MSSHTDQINISLQNYFLQLILKVMASTGYWCFYYILDTLQLQFQIVKLFCSFRAHVSAWIDFSVVLFILGGIPSVFFG